MPNNMKTSKALKLIGIGTLILMIVGFYNGYPLVYSDTGTYIFSGIEKFIPNDRPVTYGLFISLFDFDYSLWFVIVFQNLITAYVIFEVLRTLNINKNFAYIYLSILLFLVFFTGIGWYSNQIMPDFFAPISVLIIFVLIKKDNISIYTRITLSVILVYSMVSHLSHLLIGSSLIVLIVLLKLFAHKSFYDIQPRKLVFAAIIVFSSWLVLPGINAIIEKKFILAKGSHVMIMAHLNQTGILKKFLNENCNNDEFKDCVLCNYKDSLPIDLASFIWSDKQILQKSGGWIGSKKEYDRIINATLIKPKYLFLNIYRSFCYGLIQLTRNGIGQGLDAYNKGSAPYGQIHWHFHDELNNYLNSRQNLWNGIYLKLDTLNTFNLIILILSLFIVIYLFSTPISSKMDSNTITFLIFVIIAIIINSFITAGLNSPYGRFQARVVWLLPFAICVILSTHLNIIIKYFKRSS